MFSAIQARGELFKKSGLSLVSSHISSYLKSTDEAYGWSRPIHEAPVFQLALFCNGLLSGPSPSSPVEASVTASPARRDNHPLVKGPGRLHWGHSASFTLSTHASSSYHRCHAKDTTRLCDFVCVSLWGDGTINEFAGGVCLRAWHAEKPFYIGWVGVGEEKITASICFYTAWTN